MCEIRKRIQNIFMICMALIMAVSFVLTDSVRVQASNQMNQLSQTFGSSLFTVDLEMGYDGEMVYGKAFPIQGTIENLGNHFQGRFYMELESMTTGDYVEYYIPLDIASQSKQTISLEISGNQMIRNDIVCKIEDSKGEVVYQNSWAIKRNAPTTKMIGILGDNPANLQYLSGLNPIPYQNMQELILKYGESYFEQNGIMSVFFNAENFVEDFSLLQTFTMIMIDDFDVSRLSAEQILNLEKWVQQGGILFLGAGLSPEKTIFPFPLLQDIQFLERESLFTSDFEEEILITPLYHEAMEGVWTGETDRLFSQLPHGQGKFLFSHGNLSLTPLANHPNTTEYINAFLQEVAKDSFAVDMGNQGNSGTKERILNYVVMDLPPNEAFQQSFVMIYFGSYIFVACFVMYWVLKKKDKREWGWIGIPIISLVFTIGNFLYAQSSYFKNGNISTASYIDLHNGEEEANVFSIMNVRSAKEGDFKLTSNIPLMMQEEVFRYGHSSFYGFGSSSYSTHVSTSGSSITMPSSTEQELKRKQASIRSDIEGTEITFYDAGTWQTNMVSYEAVLNLGGAVTVDIWTDIEGIQVVIENQTDKNFEHSYLAYKDAYLTLEPIASKETKAFTMQFSDFTNRNYDFQWNIRQKVDDGTYTESQAYYLWRQGDWLQTYLGEKNFSGGDIPFTFFAFHKEPVLEQEMRLNEKKVMELSLSGYMMDVPLNAEEMEYFQMIQRANEQDFNNLPFGIINGTLFTIYNMADVDIAQRLEFTYNVPSATKTITLQTPVNHYGVSPLVQLEIFNQQTQTWDSCEEEQEMEAEVYMEEDGIIRYRGTMLVKGQEYYVNELLVKGGSD